MATTKAIVSHSSLKKDGWEMQDISMRPLKEKEVLVEIIATGICQTDLHFGGIDSGPGVYYPRVMGHEGAGYVREIGPLVGLANPGDPVILSYASCQLCDRCRSHRSAYCAAFQRMNFEVNSDNLIFSHKSDVSTEEVPEIYGKFFGQSSFSSMAIVCEESIVNVRGLVETKEALAQLAPLGCGIQTGAGAITEAANADESDRLVIYGLGGVGLSAIMAARIKQCKVIIGVDKVESRLLSAHELGATHIINTSNMDSLQNLTSEVKRLTDGLGATIIFDTTGVPSLIQEGLAQLGFRGKFLQAGAAPQREMLNVPILDFVMGGKQFMGVVEGDADPRVYIPQLIQWVKEGHLPLEKLVQFYPADRFKEAIHDMQTGIAVKPILLW